MFKHPLHYKKEDIGEIMQIPITLEIGDFNSEEVSETIDGVIVNCTLAANDPHLPGTIRVETTSGKNRSFSLFEIKRFRAR